jgi:hypothetical protein
MGGHLAALAWSPAWAAPHLGCKTAERTGKPHQLSANARLLFVGMCSLAYDPDPTRRPDEVCRYYRGHTELAFRLYGFRVDGQLPTKSAYSLVRRYLSELEEHGAITKIRCSKPGQTVAYIVSPDKPPFENGATLGSAILLDSDSNGATPSSEWRYSQYPNGATLSSEWRYSQYPNGATESSASEQREQREQREEQTARTGGRGETRDDPCELCRECGHYRANPVHNESAITGHRFVAQVDLLASSDLPECGTPEGSHSHADPEGEQDSQNSPEGYQSPADPEGEQDHQDALKVAQRPTSGPGGHSQDAQDSPESPQSPAESPADPEGEQDHQDALKVAQRPTSGVWEPYQATEGTLPDTTDAALKPSKPRRQTSETRPDPHGHEGPESPQSPAASHADAEAAQAQRDDPKPSQRRASAADSACQPSGPRRQKRKTARAPQSPANPADVQGHQDALKVAQRPACAPGGTSPAPGGVTFPTRKRLLPLGATSDVM